MKLAAPTNYPWNVMTDPYRPEGHPDKRHSGIDHGHGQGLAIYAPLPGRIVERRYHSEWGNRLVIEYRPGIYVTVNHLATLTDTPRLGETVRQSQRIGTMGETGKAFGVHSHMELELGGRGPEFRVDPTPYFTRDLPDTGTDQGDEELTPEERQMLADIHHTLTGGKAGVKEQGEINRILHATKTDTDKLVDSITEGKAGVRHAGIVVRMLAAITSKLDQLIAKK